MQSEIIIGLSWLSYGLIHSVLASNAAKNLLKASLGRFFGSYRLLYNILATILLIPILYIQITTPSEFVLPPSSINYILGGLMIGSGIYLVVVAIRHYNTKQFLGLEPTTSTSLQTDGLMAVVRHPIYLGILVVVWGCFGVQGTISNLVMVLAITLYVRIGVYFEEKKLVEEYGAAYRKYQKEVPMLIPKL